MAILCVYVKARYCQYAHEASVLCILSQIHWPDRYVQLFGEAMYDINQVRSDDVPFEEQLRGLENVVKAGKVLLGA